MSARLDSRFQNLRPGGKVQRCRKGLHTGEAGMAYSMGLARPVRATPTTPRACPQDLSKTKF